MSFSGSLYGFAGGLLRRSFPGSLLRGTFFGEASFGAGQTVVISRKRRLHAAEDDDPFRCCLCGYASGGLAVLYGQGMVSRVSHEGLVI